LLNSDKVASVTLASAGTAIGVSVGSFDIIPSVAQGSGLGNYSITYTNGTLVVGPATTTTVVTATLVANTTSTGTTYTPTFTATVQPQVSGIPTGHVTFVDAYSGQTVTLASNVPLVNGQATYTAPVGQLPAATNVITVYYNREDADFAAATSSTPVTVPLASAAAVSITAGQSQTTPSVTVSNPTTIVLTGFSCKVLTASGVAASGANCVINSSPASLAAGSSTQVTVTVTTCNSAKCGATTLTGSVRALPRLRSLYASLIGIPAAGFLFLGIPGAGDKKSARRKILSRLGLLVLILVILSLVACGGGGFTNSSNQQPTSTITGAGATASGSYVVTITGTDSSSNAYLLNTIPLQVY
jgi:hypothetical protein